MAETVTKTTKSSTPTELMSNQRKYWLFKSEPNKFSWDDLIAKGEQGEEWDGVRNFMARNNMRAMDVGDLGFFYHSNVGKCIVGICEVCAHVHQDSTTNDNRWECVDIRAICSMPIPITLADIKMTSGLSEMALVTTKRLSVQTVTKSEWVLICEMGGLDMSTIAK
ncbi:MAG: hypothetical protein TECD_00268 [Hyphomicrobiaceae bacterium hypho_1]